MSTQPGALVGRQRSERAEFRIVEDAEGWAGFVREGGRFFWLDTRVPEGDWTRKQPVAERTVRQAVERHLLGGEPA